MAGEQMSLGHGCTPCVSAHVIVCLQCLCGTQPGWFLANPVSGVVWSKEEAEACVCWESEGSGRETGDGLQGQQIRLGRTGHLLPGFMFLE